MSLIANQQLFESSLICGFARVSKQEDSPPPQQCDSSLESKDFSSAEDIKVFGAANELKACGCVTPLARQVLTSLVDEILPPLRNGKNPPRSFQSDQWVFVLGAHATAIACVDSSQLEEWLIS